jgi:DNA-binding transcriptional LysR family regulator
MEFRHLRSFLAVADALSFVRAAKTLHLSQPALTSQIQQLEEELGLELFFRNKRTVRLTDVGTVFVEEARAILDRTSKALERVQKASRGEIGMLRIGFVSSAALEVVPLIATAFRRRFPNVQLELTNLRTATQIEELSAKTLDVGFVRLPANHDGLDFTLIHSEPFVIALPRQHRFANKKTLHLADLANDRFVLYGRRWAPGFFDQITSMCIQSGFTPNVVQETGEMYTAIALVAAGDEVSILPKSVALTKGRGVIFKSISSSSAHSEIAIVTRSGDPTPLVGNFVQMALAARARKRAAGLRTELATISVA